MEKKATASQLVLPKGVLYVGVDESNHGRFPEIVVGAMSGLESDVLEGSYDKQRKISDVPLDWLNERDFSFLVIHKGDYAKYPQEKFIGEQISSLVQDIKNPNLHFLSILLDGIPYFHARAYVKEMVSEVCSIPKEDITFNFGPRLDERYKLVNIADGIAYNLAFHSSKKDWRKNPHRKFFAK